MRSIAEANVSRVQQSLRCLEEYAKLLDAGVAGRTEQLRYRFYTLSRAIGVAAESKDRLADVRLCVLLSGGPTVESLISLAQSLVDAGIDILQLRDKTLSDRELITRAAALREITQAAGKLLVVNDRADVAAAAHADGVHVGQDDLTVQQARRVVGPELLIGVSTHSIEQARAAVLDGANYIGVGPTFPSQTKQFDIFPGLALLSTVAAEISLPALAIGGISADNLASVLATGARRIAVGAAITQAADPAAAARELCRHVGQVS